MMPLSDIDMTVSGLHRHYQQQDFTPKELITCLRAEAEKSLVAQPGTLPESGNPIWLSLVSEPDLTRYVEALEHQGPDTLPLYGIPFAIKDNIDLSVLPTTAACPHFSYQPTVDATVVALLIKAGAIPLGKTNMDQFATGLVGTRSPYGACKNALNPDYISGGSSSGSGVAVALGQVSFSLGTDTAGSGRVPAALNHIVGLKPSKGVCSTHGVVPACRTLDCVSVFSQTVDDANAVFDVMAQADDKEPYSRVNAHHNGARYYQQTSLSRDVVIGVPESSQLAFFGDAESQSLFENTIEQLQRAGATVKICDFSAFLEAALLLYQGPWVAERYSATKTVLKTYPNAMHPVVRKIVEGGAKPNAVSAFEAQYQLKAFEAQADAVLSTVDAIITPTIGTAYTIKEVEADPIQLNSNLGYYTNFMNLLDCAAVAIPIQKKSSGIGFGITLFQKAFSDKRMLSLAAAIENVFKPDLPSGKPFTPQGQTNLQPASAYINVVVCGAHLQGLALNWQLQERGASLLEVTESAECYKLYALAGGPVARPGMVRVDQGGAHIPVELWRVPKDNFGSFVAEIPAPLGIGKVELSDGRWVTGFICEAYGLEGATDITDTGGWRNYLKTLTQA